jgi:hypothetical protein
MPRRSRSSASATAVPADRTPGGAPYGEVRPGDTVCGYRVLRKLGSGTRADVFLGFGEASSSEDSTTVAIKVFRHGEGKESVARELEALSRSKHEHVVELLDVATLTGTTSCFILERLPRGNLAHLLANREVISLGEAVTILAPIALAVDALHESGVVHGRIGPASVFFRHSGAPVVARFGHAELIERDVPPAVLSLAPGVLRDRHDLADLATFVLSSTDSAGVDLPPIGDRFGYRLAGALFDVARAEPVRFSSDSAAESRRSAVPQRLGTARVSSPLNAAGHDAATYEERARRPLLARIAAPFRRDNSTTGRVRTVVAEVAAQLSAVRKPVWVVAASVAAALTAALVLVPASDGTVARGSAGDSSENAAREQPQSSVVEDGEAGSNPVVGDDPVLALATLLEERERCIEELSVVCLDGVAQQGSQAFEVHAELILGGKSERIEGASSSAGSELTLIERLGDTALVSIDSSKSETASVLIMKGEAGWRIRDWFE